MKGSPITRREFIGTALTGLGAAACASRRMPSGGAAPAVSPARPRLRLVFYTDVHARTEWETPVAMARAAEAINAHEPDLVIAGGDLITDGFESSAATVAPRWDAYLRELHRPIRAPLHFVPGNHDLVAVRPGDGSPPAADPRSDFRERMGVDRTYSTFEAGGYRFFLLDSVFITGDDRLYEGRVPPEQLEWMRSELSGLPAGRPVILVSHMPLLTGFFQATEGAEAPAPRNRVLVNNREVLSLFGERPPLLVLQAHLHVNERLEWRGTTFITGGAVCARWWRGPWHGTEEGFGVLNLDGDRVEWEYVDYRWEARRPRGV